MEEKALKVLQILEENGYEAYIVGGYVRDKLLSIESNDIDICTSATPKQIKEIFKSSQSPNYGSINIIYKNTNYDITTFRRDIKYLDNRLPVKLKYIKTLKKDLLRRDFTINTICMNSKGEIIDTLNIMEDLNQKVIRTVGNPRYKLKEDCLRILRAVRFSTILNFEIEPKTRHYLTSYSYLLKKLSFQRKKQELDKIFSSINQEKGIKLLLELGIDKSLSLPKLKTIVPCRDIIGIWAQLEVDDIYPFTKNEKDQMNQIRNFLKQDIHNKYNIYKYGLYISTVVYQIKKEDISTLNKVYKELPIHSQSDLSVKPLDIASILQKEPDNYIKNITIDLEKQILLGNLENDYESIKKYILNYYANESKKS